MALPTVKLIAPAPYWQSQAQPSGNTYTAGSDGIVNAVSSDVNSLEAGGCQPCIQRMQFYTTAGAPVASAVAGIVSSVTLVASGGSLTIAAQPDVPRQLQAVMTPGGTMTAGVATVTYIANDSTTQIDTWNWSAVTAATTFTTSKGVVHATSFTYTAASGGVTPGIEVGTNNYLAVPLEAGFVDWTLIKETKLTPTNGTFGLMVPADETIGTATISTGLVTPTTVPDGTHWLNWGYTYNMPA